VRVLWTTILPALVVAGALVLAYGVRRPDSGVRVQTAREASVRVTYPGRRETVAGGRVPAGGTLQLRLERGRYVIRPQRGRRLRAVSVYVPDGRFVEVRLPDRRRARP
jgi:hypothetical protein